MANVIKADELTRAITQILDDYGPMAQEAIEDACKVVAKDAVKTLKKGGGFGGTGEFNKGWTSSTESDRLGSITTVYNKTQPGLAHLLEFGHAKRGGGRTKAFNFIAPVADSIADKLIDEVANYVEKKQ